MRPVEVWLGTVGHVGAQLGELGQRKEYNHKKETRMSKAKAKTVAQNVVEIPGIEINKFTVTIEGVSSLITHRFSDESKKAMLDKQMKKATLAKKAKDPEHNYRQSLYHTEDGQPGFPAAGIKKACVSACRFLDDIPMTQARGAFFIMGDIIPIDGEHRMREDIVRLGGKTADIRYRAEFPEWKITLTIRHNPRIISQEGIVNLLENAGFGVGIGDWRPEKNGSHGMFQVSRNGS